MIVGGLYTTTYKGVQVYDPSDASWSTGADLPALVQAARDVRALAVVAAPY